ncbi:MAG: hypothetical protein WC443_10115 [Desulfobaccales bacterium]
MDLTTLESVTRLLALDLDEMDAETKAQIAAKIIEISVRACGYCNRTFQRQERTSYHDGGGRYLYLPELPVQAVTEVLWAPDWDWEAATVYDTADYSLISGGMMGFRWGLWPWGDKSIRVRSTGGYDPAPAMGADPPEGYVPIPSDLEGAVCRQVAYEWRRRNDDGIRSVSLPDGTINKLDVGEWLESVEQTLKRYRIRPG